MNEIFVDVTAICFVVISVFVSLYLFTILIREWLEIISDFTNRRR